MQDIYFFCNLILVSIFIVNVKLIYVRDKVQA